MTDQYWSTAPEQHYVPPAPWVPPVTGFVLALFIPVVGIFVCHSEKKQAAAIGQDNALARAGFVFALVSCILIGTMVLLYLLIGAIALASLSNYS